jgi:hypothetical protein
VRGANYCKSCKTGRFGDESMKHLLVSLSKDVIKQKIQEELESHQQKYEYHKKISENYFALIRKTQQKLEEMS